MPSASFEPLGPGAAVLRGFVLPDEREKLLRSVAAIATASPFRHWDTRGGRRIAVAMTNCGERGWVSDRRGYRYEADDPRTGAPWPSMPPAFTRLAAAAAERVGFSDHQPDCCLVNRYRPGDALSLHVDHDERDRVSPIVSVSLGLPAVFLWGGLARHDRVTRIPLTDGDVVVWGGPSRLMHHGVARLPRAARLLDGPDERINLTFRVTGLDAVRMDGGTGPQAPAGQGRSP